LSCDLTKNPILWLIVGLGQWFLTFFTYLTHYQTRSPDLQQYTHWCSFIENTKLTKSYNLLRMIYKNLLWLQFMVQMTHAEEDGEAYFAV